MVIVVTTIILTLYQLLVMLYELFFACMRFCARAEYRYSFYLLMFREFTIKYGSIFN